MADSSLISKFVASAASIQNELSLAVANLNLDFTLIRVEAPKEFNGVNSSLSEIRRENAEGGALHRTARKLGALFGGVPPLAPELLSAYGTRVSEICEKEKTDPKERARHGIFSRFAGADSGSVWAAATSGTNAIAVHLLACMIAGMFEGPQAVSIWWELIESRKLDIEATISDEMDQVKAFAKALATKQEFSREEIASWDNSARSWMRTANSATSKQREVALLYTDKAGAVVNTVSDPYKSVMQAWKDAMTSMDSLVKGISQKVRNGAVLLAMNTWQLYPDLCVLSRGPDLIRQKDGLIKESAILTIDLEHTGEVAGSIMWSLPLSYLRYYGEPVLVTQRISVDSSRIPMDQFRFVLLGCVFSTWRGFIDSVPDAFDLVSKLLEALRYPDMARQSDSYLHRMQKITSQTSWIGQLLSAIDDFSDGTEVEKDTVRKLVDYGRRHAHFLCEPESHPPPFFGLCHIQSLFSLLEGPEPRIAYLRQLAKDLGLSSSNCVILYFLDNKSYEYATIEPVGNDFGEGDASGFIRRQSPSSQVSTKHIRWIPIQTRSDPCKCKNRCLPPDNAPQQSLTRAGLGLIKRKGKDQSCPCWDNGGCSVACHNWTSVTMNECGALHGGSLGTRIAFIESLGEHCLAAHQIDSVTDPRNGQVDFGNGVGFRASLADLSVDFRALLSNPYKKQGDAQVAVSDLHMLDPSAQPKSTSFVRLEFCAGDRDRAMILRTGPMSKGKVHDLRKGRPGGNLKELGHFFQGNTIRKALRPQDFNYYKLTEWFATHLRANYSAFVRPLQGCAAAAEMYSRLPQTTVASSVVGSISLAKARWIPAKDLPGASPLRLKLTRPEAFACIAMFESGRLLDPAYLQNVFAMTSENSIFVASPLLCDPYEIPMETEIKRVPGNIGRPGLSFLIPPPAPRIRKANSKDWTVLSHKQFSGQIEDNFRQTSMHLRLTQYQPELQGLDQHEHYIDEGTALRETLVQVYDGSTWVCDLDMLSTLRSPLLSHVVCQHIDGRSDKHSPNLPPKASFHHANLSRMVTVDNWEELLTPPMDQDLSIIRTSGNWLGRLATAGVGVRLGRPTAILPKDVCWVCAERHVENLKNAASDVAAPDAKDIILVL